MTDSSNKNTTGRVRGDSTYSTLSMASDNSSHQGRLCVSCSGKNPHYNYETHSATEGPLYCGECKKPGMIDLKRKRCEVCQKKRPNFNFESPDPKKRIPTHCAECKLPGMIDLRFKMCVKCNVKRSSYKDHKGQKGGATHCSDCRAEGMFNVKSKMCIRCAKKRPNYNFEGCKGATHCRDCKLDGMVDVKNKMCVNCRQKRASFNFAGQKGGTHCGDCKHPDMVDVKNQMCNSCKKKRASFNYEGVKGATHCGVCKLQGMINIRCVKHRMCTKCKVKRASFNIEGGRATHCGECRTDVMVNVRKTPLKEESLAGIHASKFAEVSNSPPKTIKRRYIKKADRIRMAKELAERGNADDNNEPLTLQIDDDASTVKRSVKKTKGLTIHRGIANPHFVKKHSAVDDTHYGNDKGNSEKKGSDDCSNGSSSKNKNSNSSINNSSSKNKKATPPTMPSSAMPYPYMYHNMMMHQYFSQMAGMRGMKGGMSNMMMMPMMPMMPPTGYPGMPGYPGYPGMPPTGYPGMPGYGSASQSSTTAPSNTTPTSSKSASSPTASSPHDNSMNSTHSSFQLTTLPPPSPIPQVLLKRDPSAMSVDQSDDPFKTPKKMKRPSVSFDDVEDAISPILTSSSEYQYGLNHGQDIIMSGLSTPRTPPTNPTNFTTPNSKKRKKGGKPAKLDMNSEAIELEITDNMFSPRGFFADVPGTPVTPNTPLKKRRYTYFTADTPLTPNARAHYPEKKEITGA